jgi:hypothetical protein
MILSGAPHSYCAVVPSHLIQSVLCWTLVSELSFPLDGLLYLDRKRKLLYININLLFQCYLIQAKTKDLETVIMTTY